MRVLILTEGGKGIGFGHVARCCALYEAFEEKGILSEFIVNGDNTIKDLLKDKNYRIINWLKNNSIFGSLGKFDVVIVDSYLAKPDFYKTVSKITAFPIYIDDVNRLNYPTGIVLNGSLGAGKIRYSKDKDITYLLGSGYALLRKEFWSVPKKTIRKNVRSVMITFGGSDLYSMTENILNYLCQDHPEILKYVIIGRNFKNIKGIKNISDDNTHLLYYPTAREMKEIALKSDIAISAGGQTVYELAACGIPAIVVSVASNQSNNTKSDFLIYCGRHDDKLILENLGRCLNSISNYFVRMKISMAAKYQIDGQGARRIVNWILKYTRDDSRNRNKE